MKKILILAIVACLATVLHAQEKFYPKGEDFSTFRITSNERDSILKNAPYVIEGEFVRSNINGIESVNGKYYHSYIFDIKEVYKGGNAVGIGTIEVVTIFQDAYYTGTTTHHTGFAEGRKYFLFCKQSDIKGVFQDKVDNKAVLELYLDKYTGSYDNSMFYRSFEERNRFIKRDSFLKFLAQETTGMGVRFKTWKGLKSYLHKNGLKPQKTPLNTYNKKISRIQHKLARKEKRLNVWKSMKRQYIGRHSKQYQESINRQFQKKTTEQKRNDSGLKSETEDHMIYANVENAMNTEYFQHDKD